MHTSGGLWLPATTLARREVVRFLRQRSRLIGALGQPVLFWLLFGSGLRGSFQAPSWSAALGRTVQYQEYFAPGVAVMILMFTAIFSTISIIEDRREGFLQGVLIAPIPRLAIVLGKVLGGTLLAVVQAALFLALGAALGFHYSPPSVLLILAYLTLLGAALTALGYAIAWPLDSTQGFHAVMSIFLMPMWLLSGSFFPAEGSGWLAWIMLVNPLSYGVAGLRRLMYWETALPASRELPSLAVCTTVTLVFGGVMLAVCVLQTLRRTSHDAR